MENVKTDLERFKELFSSFGIDCEVNEFEGRQWITLGDGYDRNTVGDKIKGYGGFFTEVVFDAEGNFLKIGAYE